MKKQYLLIIALLVTNLITSQNFHDTQGKLDISSSGQATYTLPIAMPPSIKDVGPVINLVYASGQLGGIAGQGWNISAISNISRMATRKDIEGFVDGVDFDDNDKLSLDGQRLILKSGTYWADGSTYQTEVQSNTKIELKGSGTTMYFIVTAPDGSRSWYGNFGGMNAVDLTAFYIVRFEDTNGNFMTYQYNINSPSLEVFLNSMTIDEIRFSANTNGNTTPLNKIKFTYKLASRWESAYIKGVSINKADLLDKIEVFTNNQLFRKYQLTHILDAQLGYQKVNKIQESNGVGELANPVEFEYKSTQNLGMGSEKLTTYSNNLSFNDIELSGDFDGDGKLDFTTNDKLYTKLFQGSIGQTPIALPFTANKRQKFTATTLSNNKLNQFQSIVQANETVSNINFEVYNLSSNALGLSYTKTINFDNSIYHDVSKDQSTYSYGDVPFPIYQNNCYEPTISNEYIEGDFNGDGISEVLIINLKNVRYNYIENNLQDYNTGNSDYNCSTQVEFDNNENYLLNLDPNASNVLGSSGFVKFQNTFISSNITAYNNRFVSDFNSDGKSDILIIQPDKTYKIVSFKQLATAPWIEIEILGQGTLDAFSTTKQILLGDYNGDGKTDVMLANTEGCQGCTGWSIYYSNPNPAGGEFFVKVSQDIVEYWPNTGTTYNTQTHFSNYYALDTNGDGKSDLVRVWRKYFKNDFSINNHDTEWKVTTFVNNIGNFGAANNFTLDYSSPSNHTNDSPDIPVPVVSNYKYQGANNELVMVRNHHNELTYIDFTKDVSQDILLTKVTSSGGNVVDEITYKTMESSDLNNGQGTMDEFYSSNNSVDYPNVEIKRLPTNNLVYQLKNTTEGLIKFQDFRYNGFVVNMNGLGSVGFNKTARSTWYQSPSAKRIWNVTENNPLQRGATLRSYSQLVDNGQSFSFVASGNPAGIINSTTNVFAANTTYSIYSLLLNNQTITDYMTNVSTVITNTYDTTYLLPLTTITQNLLNGLVQGTSTVTNEFDNNPTGIGTAYYIGRPKKSTSVATAYGDTFSTEQKYAYLNNNLSRLEKKGNTANAIYITEDYEYDVYGNLKKKTLSMPGATPILTPRITEYTYDPTGRFVKTAKDVEGLVSTNDTYHPLYGLVTSSTNPLGLTTTSIYDNWGKPTQITDFLGKSIYYSYSKTANEYTTTKTGDDGSSSIAISDALGRPKKSGVKNIDATWSYKNVEYDFLGRKYRESEPYNSGSPTLWNTSTFDDYNRIITSVTATGLTTNVTYSGLTVTGNDGTKTTSSTKNANGHVVSATDNGGTINYTYYANGNLKTSDYQGTVISMEYNEWGNKTKLTDPSAGIYTYSYYPTGESFEETTPNGKTSFYYDSVGKTIKKTIVGTNTNSETIYLYDNITKMPTTSTFKDIVNGNAITTMTFEYDTYKRLYKTTEVTPFASFTKQLTFDAFGRVEKETSTAAIGTTTSAKTIKNTYLNGYPWQILDDTGQQVLWQTNTVNARGQLTSANQGRETITNTYDQYGFATQFKHDWSFHGVSGNVMTLNTVFDPLKGNLSSRTNSMFGTTDNFAYDSLDRLTTYPNALGVLETQTYDDRGRITKNNLGDYNYTNTAKAYQNTSVTIGPEADGYYSNREGIFNDSMESQSGWDNTGLDAWAVANQATISYDATSVHSGKYALKLSNATASVKVIHTNKEILIDNATDTQYTYSAWVKSDNPSVNLFLFMKTQTETGYYTTVDNVNTTVKNQWVKIEKTVLVPASIKKLSLRLDNNGSGNVWYDDVKIRKTSNPATDIRQLNITYNTFKSPVEIGETGVDKVSFTYNDGNDRSTMFYGGLGLKETRQYRKHYSADGSMEIKQNMSTGAIEFVTYIGGDGYTAPIVLKSDGTTQKYLYLHRDYQGSILAITDATGAVVEKRLFDAWGNIVKVQDGAGNNLNVLTILDRGYTGHEHLQSVGLIHMNGRLYDPKLHRFLQPDNNIQDPYNTQNYNRYGYVLNNPLKYTDPSGEVIGIGVAVLIGAVIAATTYTMTALLADVPFTVGGLVGASFIGAFSAAVTFGIGSVATGIQQLGARMVFQALAHGMFNGMMSGVQGGNFWSGFAAGSLSSIAAGLWQGGAMATGDGNWSGLGGNFGNTDFGTIAFGTISGGAGAALTGGNFWQGAVTGLMVSALNEVAHKNSERRSFRSRFHNVDPDAEPTQSMNSVNAVIDDVDDLSEFYNSNDVDAPKINLIKNDGDAGHYYPKNDSNISKRHTIELTKNAFKSNYHLARTIFHESYHSLQYNWNGGAVIRGITAKYGRIYKNDLTGIESRGMMVLERQAYSFVWQLGDSDMYTIGEINRRKF